MSTTFSNPVYEHIRKGLLSGKLRPGMRVSEFAIAKQLGISRSPVREAISSLISEGLLQKLPGYGAYIKIPDRREIEELLVVRELLESHTMAQAAEKADSSQIKELLKNCKSIHMLAIAVRENGMTDEILTELVDLDLAFHTMIYEIANNREIIKIMESSRILNAIFCSYQKSFFTPGRIANIWRQHTRIAQAIKNHQPQLAREWLSRQIKTSRQIYIASFDELMEDPKLRELKKLSNVS